MTLILSISNLFIENDEPIVWKMFRFIPYPFLQCHSSVLNEWIFRVTSLTEIDKIPIQLTA